MAAGKFLFAIQDVIIKEMSGGYPVHQIVTIRGLVAIPLLLILIHFRGGLGLLSYLVWSETPDLMTLLGIAMIVASGIYVIRREASVEPRPIAYAGLRR
ncbi:MAG: hypothetical protein GY875_25745 [Gammaproteobacteria bacterium]|nr:hypothetical protein [Gammaproteobacteria bacterium]